MNGFVLPGQPWEEPYVILTIPYDERHRLRLRPSGDGNTPESQIPAAERTGNHVAGPRKGDVSVPATPEG